MNYAFLTPSSRIRRTPVSDRVETSGVKAYTVYNHTLLPTMFRSLEEDYHHLKSAVQVWDVGCERQIEVFGPDAERLLQMLTPRDLSNLSDDQCVYVPMVDTSGGMLNDPVAVRLAPDRYWISIADSDLMLWVKGFAAGVGLDVTVEEPEVYPLGVQGPMADDLMAAVFGDAVRDIRFFRYRRLNFAGHELVVARSGFSKQGGFEIYMEGHDVGLPLWDALMEAGAPMDVGPGCPNLIERIEGGLLSYGADMTRANTPFECGLGRFCHLDRVVGSIGYDRLAEQAAKGPDRMIRSLSIDGDPVPPCQAPWPIIVGTERVGRVTSAAWSPDFGTNVAIGMLDRAFWEADTQVAVQTPDGPRTATVQATTFI